MSATDAVRPPDEPQRTTVELSVVMPAFNSADTIGEQLQALLEQDWSASWEVVVADNGSTDRTTEIVGQFAALDPRFRLVDASARRGASYARNTGVAASTGSSIAFCDSDDVVSREWVRRIGEALREHAFVTGPQEYERLNPSWMWGIYGTVQARELQMFEGIFPFGPTANLGVHRQAFDRIGGFDVAISPYEDLDLCLRLWMGGVALVFVEEATVHYRYRQDLRSIWSQAVSYGTAAPAIASTLQDSGHPTPSRWRGLRRLVWLARHSIRLADRQWRARWLVVAGTIVGHAKGSVRSRWFMM